MKSLQSRIDRLFQRVHSWAVNGSRVLWIEGEPEGHPETLVAAFTNTGKLLVGTIQALRRNQFNRSIRVTSPRNSLSFMTMATRPRLKISMSCGRGASAGTVTR